MSSATAPEIVFQGWLTKSSPSKGILFRPRWRRRWFLLRAGTYPNQYVLEYFTDNNSCRRPKGQVNLDVCEQVTVQDRAKFAFLLRIPGRTYYLTADSEADMHKWVECLCHVCGLKTTENEGSSPTLSERLPSGPYIPISECFTGKPIFLDEKPPSAQQYMNQTSFPFPPKVNWATHPGKKESTDSATTAHAPDAGGLIAPPRPPKKLATIGIGSSAANVSPLPVQDLGKTGPSSAGSATTQSVFHYDHLEEAHDSSSTCSSLHSPPGSAGGACYTNISEINKTSPIYQNPPSVVVSHQHQSSLPASCDSSSFQLDPPKVDRNLKPDLRKTVELCPRAYQGHPLGPQQPQQYHHQFHYRLNRANGAMTLPTRTARSPAASFGPAIDRSRKPSDSALTLGPTPVQVKEQSAVKQSSNSSVAKSLPATASSPRRRVGPALYPHESKPCPLPEPELTGTYLQIDCKTMMDGENKVHNNFIRSKRGPGAAGLQMGDTGAVEYRMIDHIKTKALNQMRQDREEQLRNNIVSTKNLI